MEYNPMAAGERFQMLRVLKRKLTLSFAGYACKDQTTMALTRTKLRNDFMFRGEC